MAFTQNIVNGIDSATDKINDATNSVTGPLNDTLGAIGAEVNSITNFLDRFDSSLPHYKHSKAAIHSWEPVYLNQFDVIITPPNVILENDKYADLLMEQIKSVDGLPEIIPTGTVEQRYMWATRTFSKPIPEKTTADITISFEVNINSRRSLYVYETLRAWAELQFNPEIGMYGLKGDYTGIMSILINNKQGKNIRQLNFNPVYLAEPLTAMTLDYLSEEIYVLQATFKADAWKEKRNK